MGRPLLQRLLVLLSFATSLATAFLLFALLPSSAHAAIVPACENHQLTRMPVEWLVNFETPPAPADTCTPNGEREQRAGDAGTTEELSDSRVAAMCDGRGASVVAPPLVRPVADARIDAAYGCNLDITSSMPGAGPAPNDSPLSAPAFALAQPATLDDQLLITPTWSELGPPYPAARGAASAGIRRGIDHPPK